MTPPRDDGDTDPEVGSPGGSGRGGALGTPGPLPDETPPSADQESNEAVSGGGMVSPDDEDEARRTAKRSRSD